MRKHLTVLATASALLASTFALQPAHAATDGSDLIINEAYTRGGSANQPYQQKFVELYNPTASSITLSDGWGLGYSARTNASVGNVCTLTGEIAAGGFRVIAVGSNGSTGEEISPDQTCGNIDPSGTNGSYTLLNGSTEVDVVGWGTAVRYEGTGAATYTGGNTTAGAITRTGAADTDNNAADFTFTATPHPGLGRLHRRDRADRSH